MTSLALLAAPAVVTHQIAPPAPEGTLSLEYIKANTKLVSLHGKIIMLEHKTVSHNSAPTLDGFDRFRHGNEIEKADTMEHFTRRKILLIQYTNGEHSNALYEALRAQCDFFALGVSVVPVIGNVNSAVMHNHKRPGRIRIDTNLLNLVECIAPVLRGKYASHVDDTIFKFVEAWVSMQQDIVANFTVTRTATYNGGAIMEEWAARDQFAIDADINGCPKRQRTLREAYISDNHLQLVRMWKGMTADIQSKPYITVSDPSILSFNDIPPPPQEQAHLPLHRQRRRLQRPAVQRQRVDHVRAPQENRHLPWRRRLRQVSRREGL